MGRSGAAKAPATRPVGLIYKELYSNAMSLDRILLGLLCQPRSGYDLKAEFDGGVRHFWQANLAQVYPTLKRLEAEGLLRATTQPSDRGPDRRVYQTTRRGRAALVEWLSGEPDVGDVRLTLLAQVFFLGELGGSARALRFMRQMHDQLDARLKKLRGIEAGWRSADPAYPDALDIRDFYAQFTLDLGLRTAETRLKWCDDCIARLQRRGGASSARRGAPGKTGKHARPRPSKGAEHARRS
jgi:DNA-binding PadR family transcriptional regulator